MCSKNKFPVFFILFTFVDFNISSPALWFCWGIAHLSFDFLCCWISFHYLLIGFGLITPFYLFDLITIWLMRSLTILAMLNLIVAWLFGLCWILVHFFLQFCLCLNFTRSLVVWLFLKGWGQSAKLGKHSAIWGKLGTALQAYTLNPCTKFAANPTSRKVNT